MQYFETETVISFVYGDVIYRHYYTPINTEHYVDTNVFMTDQEMSDYITKCNLKKLANGGMNNKILK